MAPKCVSVCVLTSTRVNFLRRIWPKKCVCLIFRCGLRQHSAYVRAICACSLWGWSPSEWGITQGCVCVCPASTHFFFFLFSLLFFFNEELFLPLPSGVRGDYIGWHPFVHIVCVRRERPMQASIILQPTFLLCVVLQGATSQFECQIFLFPLFFQYLRPPIESVKGVVHVSTFLFSVFRLCFILTWIKRQLTPISKTGAKYNRQLELETV